jgi:hypothetical protein
VFVPGESIRRFVTLIFEEDSENKVIALILYGFPSFPCLYHCQDWFHMLVFFTHASLLVWFDSAVYVALRTLRAVFLRSHTGSRRVLLTHLLSARKVTGLFLTEEMSILVALSEGNRSLGT